MRFLKIILFFLFISFNSNGAEDQFEPFVENGRVGLKNTTTNTIAIPASFQSIGWSDKGFQIINGTIGAKQNEKWALIDLQGHKITDHLFNNLSPTQNENLIASKRLDQSILIAFGIIDIKGKTLVPFEFSGLKSIEGRLIATKKKGKSYSVGLLSEKGTELIPLEFDTISLLNKEHLAVRNREGLSAIFDLSGNKLTDFQFESISPINDQLYLISKYNHQGLLNKQLQMILPPLYKSLKLSKGKIDAVAYDQWDYFNVNSYKATYYYDKVNFTKDSTFVTLSNSKTSIINLQDDHLKYLPDETYHDGNEDIFVTKVEASGRYKVYSSDGKNLFGDSFDEVALFEQVFFARINQPNGHSWGVYNFSGKKLNLSNYQTFKRRSQEFFEANQNGKIGIISKNGKEISPFLYDNLSPFQNGRAIALYNKRYGLINDNGIWIMTPYFDSLKMEGDLVHFKQGTEYGVADLFGKVKYRSQGPFEIYSSVISRMQVDSTWVLFDLMNQQLLEPSYERIISLDKDLLLLRRDNQYFLYRISDRADFILDKAINDVGTLINGFIPILKDDHWGFLNAEGRLAIANRYEEIQNFSEGFFPVKLIGKWGFVNELEELVIQPNFDSVEPFQNGLSIVKNNEKYGLINPQGRFELELKFENIERLDQYFLIKLNGLLGLADPKGRIIKNPNYQSIEPIENGYLLVNRNGNFGVIDLEGDDIIPTNYIEIKQSRNKFIGRKTGENRTFQIK